MDGVSLGSYGGVMAMVKANDSRFTKTRASYTSLLFADLILRHLSRTH